MGSIAIGTKRSQSVFQPPITGDHRLAILVPRSCVRLERRTFLVGPKIQKFGDYIGSSRTYGDVFKDKWAVPVHSVLI